MQLDLELAVLHRVRCRSAGRRHIEGDLGRAFHRSTLRADEVSMLALVAAFEAPSVPEMGAAKQASLGQVDEVPVDRRSIRRVGAQPLEVSTQSCRWSCEFHSLVNCYGGPGPRPL